MDSKYNEYVVLSAKYCELLFASAREFFAANVVIESVIADRLSPASDLCHAATVALGKCSSYAFGAGEYLKYYKVAHQKHPGGLLEIDFSEQEARLNDVVSIAQNASHMIKEIELSADLQQAIWDDESITEAITGCAKLISQAILWQCGFAEKAHDL